MKISDLNQLGIGATEAARQTEATEGRVAGRTKAGKSEDRAELSGAAAVAAQEATGGSPSHVARVNRLQELVRTGRYHADAAQVASKIVDDALGPAPAKPGGER